MASFGYAGDVGPGEWVTLQRVIGCRYAIVGLADFALGVTTSGITLTKGAAGGGGVYDEWATTQSVNLTKPASGTQWWMICIRRNWTAQTTSLVAIPAGTATPVVLPSRNTTMGVIDDQPLWLVPWASSNSTPALGSAVDLRLIGRGPSNYLATSPRVKEYFTEPGASLRIGAQDWLCVVGVGSTLTWVQMGILGTAGSNSNGTWYTSPDGRRTCHHTLVFPAKANQSQTLVWTFPITFPEPPMVKPILQTTVPENCRVGVTGRTTTNVAVEFFRTTGSTTTVLLEANSW